MVFSYSLQSLSLHKRTTGGSRQLYFQKTERDPRLKTWKLGCPNTVNEKYQTEKGCASFKLSLWWVGARTQLSAPISGSRQLYFQKTERDPRLKTWKLGCSNTVNENMQNKKGLRILQVELVAGRDFNSIRGGSVRGSHLFSADDDEEVLVVVGPWWG